jgi:hypothetical protein
MHRIRKLHDDEDVGKIVSGSVAVSSEIVNMGLDGYPLDSGVTRATTTCCGTKPPDATRACGYRSEVDTHLGLNTNYPETLFWRCEPASRRRSVRSIENKSGMDNLMKRSAVASFDEFLAKRSAVGESNT